MSNQVNKVEAACRGCVNRWAVVLPHFQATAVEGRARALGAAEKTAREDQPRGGADGADMAQPPCLGGVPESPPPASLLL